MKLLLFDVDQTLVSTGGAGIVALNRACRKIFAMENAMEGILPHGKTDPGIVREIFASRSLNATRESIDEVIQLYVMFLVEEVKASTTYRVLPGIMRVLEELSNRSDVLLGLATGNVEAGARIKLERGNLNEYFAFGGFGSDSEDRTGLVRRAAEMASARWAGDIHPDDTFVIGDTPRDIAAGREAGFQTVGVATGQYSLSELGEAGATFAITDFEQDRDQFMQATLGNGKSPLQS